MSSDAEKLTDTQVGGNHYQKLNPQPIVVILRWGLPFCIGNVVKYLLRYQFKNGIEDLKKAIQYLQFEKANQFKNTINSNLGYFNVNSAYYQKCIAQWNLWFYTDRAMRSIGRGLLDAAIEDIQLEIERLSNEK